MDGGDGTVFLAAPSEGPATKVEALCRLLGATQASGDIRILLSVTVCSLLPSPHVSWEQENRLSYFASYRIVCFRA